MGSKYLNASVRRRQVGPLDRGASAGDCLPLHAF